MDTFDYVIVGGGSAGAILAARLSEDPGTTVCLLEAGPRDRNPFIHLPAGFIKVIFDPKLTWGYETEPGPHIDNRRLPVLQGKVLGGSGSINGMVWVRGQREDFDGWAEAGAEGWSYDAVLPYFRKLERRIGGGDQRFRGSEGGIPVMDLSWKNDLVEAFIEGAKHSGIPYNADYNGEEQQGVGRYQYNIGRGKRYSAAKAYLAPAAKRRNLDVRTEAQATRVLLEGKKAVGVEYRIGSDPALRQVRARREVVLCAGAVNSPKLLMHSGIGPADVLAQAGVPLVQELPGVGRNYMDHFTPRLTYKARNAQSINGMASGPRLWGQMLRWAVGRPSILGMGVVLGAAFWKTRPELNRPNVVVTFTPGTFKQGFLGRLDDFPGMTTGVWQLRPDSRGWVKILSPDPLAKPSIQPNFLAEESDQRTAVEGIRLVRQIMDTPKMRTLTEAETMPGPGQSTDEELLAYSRSQGLCGYHASGTAKMGRADDPAAVVDSRLRVRGIEGLRVADASIMPVLVSGNTNAATMMIAEKAADLLRT